MLDGLLKSKFHTRCKSLIKMTKTRLDVLKKKKCSVIKFLRNDMADLLRNGLDYNAFCRAEGLLVEQKMIACYNFIEQFSSCISTNVTSMAKQRECPEECREAVQSLIYAAARIAELTELRDLRSLFTDRYGCLEAFINKEFVETLKPTATTKEMKLQLLHDIASDFNIEWNSKSLEQKLFIPPSAHQDQHKHESLRDADDSPPKTNKRGLASHKSKTNIDEKYNLASSEDDSLQAAGSSSVGSVSEDEIDSRKPFNYRIIPPPYVRPQISKQESKIEPSNSEPNDSLVSEETTHQDDLGDKTKLKPKSVRRKPMQSAQENISSVDHRPLKPPPGREKFLKNMGSGVGWFSKNNASALNDLENGDDKIDEEEKMLDGLLMHYCKDKAKPINDDENVDSGLVRNAKSDSELRVLQGREAERATANKARTTTRHSRAVSLQPETGNGHVHPKMPDCDDIAARIAAFRAR